MIRKFLDLSTEHISLAARDWLDNTGALEADRTGNGGPHNVALTHHGWLVYAPELNAVGTGLHKDLVPVAAYAREQGCDYILFDGDADVVDELPIFDWDDAEKGSTMKLYASCPYRKTKRILVYDNSGFAFIERYAGDRLEHGWQSPDKTAAEWIAMHKRLKWVLA
jgi:hypothetical protein